MQNARKLKAWFWIWRVFGTNSHLNKTARFGKNDAISLLFTQKKERSLKRCRFKRHCRLSSSPRRTENRGRRRFCSPVFTDISPLPLSPKTQKDADLSTPLAWILTGGLPQTKKNRRDKPQLAPPSTLPCPLIGQGYGIFTALLCL